MRDPVKLLNSFITPEETEYEARLFIDKAIKGNVEYYLQTLAISLCGRYKLRYKHHSEPIFEDTETHKSNEGNFFTITKKYAIVAKMKGREEFCFYGNSFIEIYLKVIAFWAQDPPTVFPCGGSNISDIKP